MIRHSHHGDILVTVKDVLYLREMDRVWALHDTLSAMGSAGKAGDSWKAAVRLQNSGLGMDMFERMAVEVLHHGTYFSRCV